jgi:hypothetical protein
MASTPLVIRHFFLFANGTNVLIFVLRRYESVRSKTKGTTSSRVVVMCQKQVFRVIISVLKRNYSAVCHHAVVCLLIFFGRQTTTYRKIYNPFTRQKKGCALFHNTHCCAKTSWSLFIRCGKVKVRREGNIVIKSVLKRNYSAVCHHAVVVCLLIFFGRQTTKFHDLPKDL